jgi:hypothetical protein
MFVGLRVLLEPNWQDRMRITSSQPWSNTEGVEALVEGAAAAAAAGARDTLGRWKDVAIAGPRHLERLVNGLFRGCCLRFSEVMCELGLRALQFDILETVPAAPITDAPPWGPKGGQGPAHVATLAGVGTKSVRGVFRAWNSLSAAHHAGSVAAGLQAMAGHQLSAGLNQLLYNTMDMDYEELVPPGGRYVSSVYIVLRGGGYVF